MASKVPGEGPSSRRILGASLVGTGIEFYDFYIYATAASIVFGPLFFPAESASAQLLLAYASFGLAFLARPLGASLFGHFGDRVGRKSTLVASLLLMGGSTTAIAFLPTYEQIGWWAPFLLCLLRVGQGLGLGGEWGGAALLAVENAPPGWRARFGMFPQLGAPLGFIAANGLFLLLGMLLTTEQFREWGWRIPFLLSAALVAVGLWVRLRLTETPAFRAALEKAPPPRVPLVALLVHHWRQTLAGIFAVVACFAIFYIATAFALGHGTTELQYSRESFLSIQLGAIFFLAFGIILAGWLSDRFNSRAILMLGCAATVPSGLLLAPMMVAGSPVLVLLFLSLMLLLMGFVYGPLGDWLPGLFPAQVRYTGASVAFNVGGIMGGGFAPIISQWLASEVGLFWVGVYLSVAAAISFIALWLAGPSAPAEDYSVAV
jgi:metabolite-proton symporter